MNIIQKQEFRKAKSACSFFLSGEHKVVKRLDLNDNDIFAKLLFLYTAVLHLFCSPES